MAREGGPSSKLDDMNQARQLPHGFVITGSSAFADDDSGHHGNFG
jgi:hypothetical protein